ncbi:MAG: AraC family transcriptional regulator [Culicoidibacterales bacterium]
MMKNQSQKEAVQHGKQLFPLEVYQTKLAPGGCEVTCHWHDEMELLYVQSGQAVCQIDLETYPIQTGDFLMIKSGQLHSITPKTTDFVSDACVFQLSFLKSATHDVCELEYIAPLIRADTAYRTHLTAQDRGHLEVTAVFKNLILTYEQKQPAYELEIKSLFYQFLMLLYRYNLLETKQEIPKVRQQKIQTMKQVLHYIEVNYPYPLQVMDLAKIANYSEFHFLRFFRQETGMRCTEYINNLRLEHAFKQLIATELSITEVAGNHGFENVSYFIKKFKQKYGQTPSKYRQTQSQKVRE